MQKPLALQSQYCDTRNHCLKPPGRQEIMSAKLPSVGIIGGGPAGLSLARLLQETGKFSPTVFEANPQLGGKSFSFLHGDAVVEMGTCYTTRAHWRVLGWMKEAGIGLRPLGEQVFDGEDFMDYVKRGDGPSLAIQVPRFLMARRKLMAALARKDIPAWAETQAAEPVADWLRARKLHKIERFMYRSMTNLGYGFVDETPTVQAMRWNDLDLILTGLLKQLKMPAEGWTTFWERAAAKLDVRLDSRVTAVDRSGPRPAITTSQGDTFEFDQIVCTIPIDDFVSGADATENEKEVASAIRWNGYTTTLVAVEDWFDDVTVHAYSSALLPGSPYGRMMSARIDGDEPELGGKLYLTGQLSGSYTDAELQEILIDEIAEHGGKPVNTILQKTWKYFAQYDNEAVRNGLLRRFRDMQGEKSTWYSGSTFSHEAVSNIVNFNAGLVRQMLKHA